MEREYTPIVHICDTNTDASHNLMLMIKIYPHGKMTRHLSKIKVGKFNTTLRMVFLRD